MLSDVAAGNIFIHFTPAGANIEANIQGHLQGQDSLHAGFDELSSRLQDVLMHLKEQLVMDLRATIVFI